MGVWWKSTLTDIREYQLQMGVENARLLTFPRNGLNMRPQPFECSITPRSEEIRKTIIREGEQALADLQQYAGESKYRMSTFYQKSDRAMKLYGNPDEKH
jgi:hypothetical protein